MEHRVNETVPESADGTRWEQAQQAEVAHESHSTGWDREGVQRRLSDSFGYTIEELREQTVLEVGCGNGMIHSIEGPSIGVDPILPNVRQHVGESPAALLTGVGEALPLRSDSVDIVILYNVLDHTKDPAAVLAEVRRVLAPGGDLLFHVNAFALPGFVRRRLSLIDRPHPHHFSPAEVRSMIEDAGFEIERYSSTAKSANLRQLNVKRIAAVALFRIRTVRMLATVAG